jgi:hypothetical protein
MRTLSASLTAAQKAASRTPYVKLEATNEIAGVVRLDWSRLYTGTEDDYYHAITMPGDGSLVRARITLVADNRKLYRQRVTSPGVGSDYASWTYTSQYNCIAVAAASLSAEVSIFWVNTSREIQRIKSTDSGATWGSPELIGYSSSSAVTGLAAAYKSNGDLAIFWTIGSTLTVKKHVGGSWQSDIPWSETTGDLSGVATVYDGDWNLLVTGKDTDDNYKVWSIVYGDGGEVPAGTWSTLKEIASAPTGGDFEYVRPFLDKPDVYRAFYVESFDGTVAYDRPFWTHTVAGTDFADCLWREPVPFDVSTAYGLALAFSGDYCWAAMPAGIWRASKASQSLDITGDVVSLGMESHPGSGGLTAVLDNARGAYTSPGTGSVAVLDVGCQLEFSPGYVTSQGNESSAGPAFLLEAYEHTGPAARATLTLHAPDAWATIARWRARHQFRWNKSSDDASVKEILQFVLARLGLALSVKSESSVVTGFYPDFAINPGHAGDAVVARLLSFVPDVLFIEGATAYLVNPLAADSSAYSYGGAHAVLEGRYRTGAQETNWVRAEGRVTQSPSGMPSSKVTVGPPSAPHWSRPAGPPALCA